MSDDPRVQDAAETVADGVTALVNVTDEGLKVASANLERIAESIGGVLQAAALVGTVIGRAADKGKDGTDGRSIWSGQGTPATDLGGPGDLYLDVLSGDVWQQG